MNISQQTFDTAQMIGNKGQKYADERQQRSKIEEILEIAHATNDPKVLENTIDQVIAGIKDPNDRLQMINRIQNKSNEIIKEKEKEALIQEGINPNLPIELQKIKFAEKEKMAKSSLTLNESLNQTEKRYQNKTKALRLPFEKSDSFGNIFLDFAGAEGKREAVLGKLDKELEVYTAQVAKEYRKAGMPVPQDILDDIENSVQVKVGDEVVSLKVASKLEEFSKANPPAKYKGQTATDSNGNKIYSDGVTWSIVENQQEVKQ